MRVASLESVLAVATLVSAAVVVLWGLRILYGAWTSRSLRRFKWLPRGFLRHRQPSAAAEVLLVLFDERLPCAVHRSVHRRSRAARRQRRFFPSHATSGVAEM